MRQLTPFLESLLDAGGPFIGDYRASTRITVEPNWWLTEAAFAGNWPANKLPVRWWQRKDNSQVEVELPNLQHVTIDRTLTQDAATMTVDMYNTMMTPMTGVDPFPGQLGEPGYFTWTRGTSDDARARWGQNANEWSQVLQPNALLRVYQGYGGHDLALKGSGGIGDGPAIADGYVMLTGVFLVDTVSVDSGTSHNRGPMLHLQCRDMFKLLIDQQLYPPLVPSGVYPLFYTRGATTVIAGYTTPPQAAGAWQTKRCVWVKSGNDVWYGVNASVDGHRPTDSVDHNLATFWLSVGNAGPQYPFAVEWVEYDVQEDINGIWLAPWAGNYTCWISVMVNGVWQGAGVIPYSTGGVGRYVGAYAAAIHFVMNFGVGWEVGQWVALPSRMHAQRVRYTFSNLVRSPWGPYEYRAGLREVAVGDNGADLTTTVGPTTQTTPANYTDYVDVVKDILLWSGFWLYDPAIVGTANPPEVYGNLETTGAPGSGSPVDSAVLGNDFFEKKAPIDPLKALRDVVGYILRCDGSGAARFESPNWWTSGNFYDDGSQTSYIPSLDERLNVTDFTVAGSDAALRSQIITCVQDPALFPTGGTPISRFLPDNALTLRGLQKPAILGLLSNATQTDANVLAELIALQIWFIQRQGTVTAIFRPDIDIDTQVRVFDRVSGETYVHYVRGVHTEHDLDAGTHTMTLTTNWLGDRNTWAITTDPASFGFPVSETLQAFIAAQSGRKTEVFRVGAFQQITIVNPYNPL
jgi:hypothetical protein